MQLGGVLVVPVNDHLKRIERLGEDEWKVEDKLSVSFASLIEPSVSGHKTELTMREWESHLALLPGNDPCSYHKP